MTASEVRAELRACGGDKCSACGMTNDAHLARYGSGLQTHRKVPGSAYTVEGCELLCRPCHGKKPKGDCRTVPGRGTNINVWMSGDVVDAFRETCRHDRRQIKAQLEIIITEYLTNRGLLPRPAGAPSTD